jgi:hypothetical protein
MPLPTYQEFEVEGIIGEVISFVEQQQQLFEPWAVPLNSAEKTIFRPYFPSSILRRARIVRPNELRVLNPPFADRARARGFSHMPDFSHLGEVTFGHVIVMQAPPSDRLIFHALVKSVQYALMGTDTYVEAYITAFVRTGLHVTVPLEAHTFELDYRFVNAPSTVFSVEEEVRQALGDGRYCVPAD